MVNLTCASASSHVCDGLAILFAGRRTTHNFVLPEHHDQAAAALQCIHIVQEAKPMLPLADLLEGPPATGTGWSYIFETFWGNLTRIMRLHRTTALSTIACDANRAEHLAPCSV